MPDLWPLRELGGIGVRVLDCEHKTPPGVARGYPYIAIPDIVDGRVNVVTARQITSEDLEQWTRRTCPQSGDVIITRRGRVGDSAVIPPDLRCAIGQNLVILRSDGEYVTQAYLRWATRGESWLSEVDRLHNVGAIFDSLNVSDIPRMRIFVPPLNEQLSIASVLDPIDGKIATNEQIRGNADGLLRAHFATTVQQAHHTARLGQVISLRYGKALQQGRRVPGPFPVYGGNGVSGWHQTSLVDGPGIIVGRKGANAGSVSWSQGSFWPIDTAFYVESTSSNIPFEFLFLLLDNINLRQLVGDSAIPGLSREVALGYEVPFPSREAIEQFATIARPLLSLQAHVANESRSLTILRNVLLPRLMSGEIRVRDAERLVEDAT